MKLVDYSKDKILLIVTSVIIMMGLSAFLFSVGNSYSTILSILIVYLLCLIIYFLLSFFKRKKEMDIILNTLSSLDEKYLISELIKKPTRSDDYIYYSILKACNKSMLENVAKVRREQKEYREYIEQWVHEIKTPISAIELICENNKNDIPKTFLVEISKIHHFAEQVLFYARSGCVEKDYHISEYRLSDLIHNSISENKTLLLHNNISIEVENSDIIVLTDKKWIVFIINQLLINSVKYKKESLTLTFSIKQEKDFTILTIADDGIGISEEELPRIFDKGFTGTNGRKSSYSTGIGLYLCNKLCTKLGLSIEADSSELGTNISITFYKNPFLDI